MKWAFLVKTLIKQRAPLRFGSDAPVEPIEPLRNLQACERIWNKEERVDRIVALRHSTKNQSLSLRVGQPADLCLWPAELLTIANDQLLTIKPLYVWKKGELVFSTQKSA